MNADDIPTEITSTLDYGWDVDPQDTSSTFDPDPSSFGTLDGLILEVPYDAQKIYLIDFDPDDNKTLMLTGPGDPIPELQLTPARITVVAPDPAKNRYLTFVPREPGPVAYKLDMVSSFVHPNAIVSGWVGAPDAKGIASLQPNPVTRDWEENFVHITGCEIAPAADFELRATTDGGGTFLPAVILKITDRPTQNRWWGDVAGFFNGTYWSPPQGVTNIADAGASGNEFRGQLEAQGIARRRRATGIQSNRQHR